MENKNKEKAVDYFLEGNNCAQAIVRAFNNNSEKEVQLILNLAQPFGGGMAKSGRVCGAVSGALMAIGLKYSDQNNPFSKAKVQEESTAFIKEFIEKNGSLNCKELLEHDMSTEEGRKAISELQLRDTVCKDLIASSGEILEKIFAGLEM